MKNECFRLEVGSIAQERQSITHEDLGSSSSTTNRHCSLTWKQGRPESACVVRGPGGVAWIRAATRTP